MPRRKTPEVKPEPAGFEETNLNAVGPEPAPRASKQRMSVTLNERGELDLDALRPATKEQLKKVLASAGPLFGSEVKLTAIPINREFVPQLYDTLASGVSLVGSKLFKWPPELTQFIRYSDEEKKALTEPTARVLEKYSPTWLLKYQEEVALLQMLVVASRSMVERAVAMYVMTLKAQAEAPPTGAGVEAA